MKRILAAFLLLFAGACTDSTLQQALPQIEVQPEAISFSPVSVGLSTQVTLTIASVGKANLDIDSIELSDKGSDDVGTGVPYRLVVEAEEDPLPVVQAGPYLGLDTNSVVTVQVRFTPSGDGVAPGNSILISSNDPDEPVVEVPIMGEGTNDPMPDIQVVPESFQFGSVALGDSTQGTLTVSNVGNGNLLITAVYINGPTVFTIDTAAAPTVEGAVFRPAESRPLVLRFVPQDSTYYTGDLIIESNDPDEPVLTIPLEAVGNSGTGLEPECDMTVTAGATWDPSTQTWLGTPLTLVNISAAGSTSSTGLPLTYQWVMASRPAGSNVFFFGNGATASFTPDLAGTYVVRVMVVDSDGLMSAPCELSIVVAPNENFRVEMYWSFTTDAWSGDGEDMDLHLVRTTDANLCNGTNDCGYSNCIAGPFGPSGVDWGTPGDPTDDPNLDIDDIPGTGPENINIDDPVADTYYVYVRDYPWTDSWEGSPNPTTVRIYLNGTLAASYTSTDDAGSADFGYSEGNFWKVVAIEWPAATLTPFWTLLTNSTGC